jgi:predicted nucleic acid-binding protein
MYAFYAPDIAYTDAGKYLPLLLAKRGKPDADVSSALRYLQQMVHPVDRETYAAFEEDARVRLHGRDDEDWPVLAKSLAMISPIWTEDTDFFGTGIAVWTTNRVDIFLKELARSIEREGRKPLQ